LLIDIYARLYQNGQVRTAIIVEAKCFDDIRIELNELYTAIGQYVVYRSLLKERQVTAPLYLAVPKHAYEGIFQQIARDVTHELGIKTIVVDIDNEVVEQWLE
jgi:hypothetical protein